MIKKISDKDKKDWENFLKNKKKTPNKDTVKKSAMAKGDMFAQLKAIDQSSGKTAGLRQTKKNSEGKRIVENDKSNVMTYVVIFSLVSCFSYFSWRCN